MTASPRTVLITGCSSGIGHATARHLQQAGWLVYASARRLAALDALAQTGCRLLELDVTDESSARAAVARIEQDHGALDALVNNAAYSESGAVETVSLDRMRAQFETNVFGAMRLAQLVLPAMRKRRQGAIINVSSMGGRLVLPGAGVYHASKYALEALSDALRFEVEGFGIRVVLVEPGLIRTRFGDTASAAALASAPGDDAYEYFHSEVGRITRESYVKGSLAPFVSDPELVARTIEQALLSTRPKARYVVGPSASLLLTLRRLLSDRQWDRFLGRTYPRPGRQDSTPRT